MKILFMGGTRFVGKALVEKLLSKENEITIFTRGKNLVPENIHHICGDRKISNDLDQLSGSEFDVIVDSSGRKLEDTQTLLSFTGFPKHRFVYISSAGLYADTGNWPLQENSKIDPKSRHYGKSETEDWLTKEKIPFTSFRPTYIYGVGNYNPIEKWFFDRITHNMPIPLPGDGNAITQLGHVNDLADAIKKSIYLEIAKNQIYNCSSDKGITLNGLVATAALACGTEESDLNIVHFDNSKLDSKARKLFPLRTSHFFTDISKVKSHLSWEPKIELYQGLRDFYLKDYLQNIESNIDFSNDHQLLTS